MKLRAALAAFLFALALAGPKSGSAHPMGNFSINHYAKIVIGPQRIELHYYIDMAEIPTFQEIRDNGFVARQGDPSALRYLAHESEKLKSGLLLKINGEHIKLRQGTSQIIFPPGAGGLPTMKIAVQCIAALPASLPAVSNLEYRDLNFPTRAGWKEVIAVARDGATTIKSSAPAKDRSDELTNYPTDLLNTPPQTVEAEVDFRPDLYGRAAPDIAGASPASRSAEAKSARAGVAQNESGPILKANLLGTPRDAFTQLITTGKTPDLWFLIFAALVAAGLGALHALEPGHGKTLVAAYLVGSRGSAGHALLLGAVVTASHTVSVYALGILTLYGSRLVVPEHLYPLLGTASGLLVGLLGITLFTRRYGNATPHIHVHGEKATAHRHNFWEQHTHEPPGMYGGRHIHSHLEAGREIRVGRDAEEDGARVAPVDAHEGALALHSHSQHHHCYDHHDCHEHDPDPHHHHGARNGHDGTHTHAAANHGLNPGAAAPSVRALFALGVAGGVVPCPAALVVLLAALSLHRVGFGLFLIVAFSIGLAAVLIAFGLAMVYARRFMSRFNMRGPLTERWLPLVSSAAIIVVGFAMAINSLMSAGIVKISL